jgi:hypothetical protein
VRLPQLHPVAEEAGEARREAREDHYGFRRFRSDWKPPLYLAKTSIGHAIRILGTIAKEVVGRGGEVTSYYRDIRLVFSGEHFYLQIYELKERVHTRRPAWARNAKSGMTIWRRVTSTSGSPAGG